MAVSPSSELISAAETSYLFECLQSTSLQEHRLLEDSGFALFAPVSPTLGTMPKTYNCFLSSWEVSVLMSVFQTRQHCHEETEIRRAKSFVQDHIVMSSRPLLGQDGFFKIHLLAACWLSIKIILLLLGRGCWEVLWRIRAGIKCQSMRLEPLRITRKLSHTFTVSLFSCVQTYFESSPCLQALGWLVPEGPGYRCCCSCQPSNTHTAFASAGLISMSNKGEEGRSLLLLSAGCQWALFHQWDIFYLNVRERKPIVGKAGVMAMHASSCGDLE